MRKLECCAVKCIFKEYVGKDLKYQRKNRYFLIKLLKPSGYYVPVDLT
jgi:hypothetical protein